MTSQLPSTCVAIMAVLAVEAMADSSTTVAVEPRAREPGEPIRRDPALPPPDVQSAPLPGNESGRIDAGDGGDSVARRFFRGLLFVPRVVVNVALFPVHAGLRAEERYLLEQRYRRTFFNRDETMGMYPTLWYEAGFSPRVGARFFDRDVFEANERLTLSGEFGGNYQARVDGSFATGDRLGERLEVELHATYDRQPREYFFGIGNGDTVDSVPTPIDPLTSDVAVESRYRARLARTTTIIDVGIWKALHARVAGALGESTFAASTQDAPIGDIYEPDRLVGFEEGVTSTYTEAALQWDDRGRGSLQEPASLYATGTLASLFAGRTTLLDDETGFWRYGFDFQQFVRIAEAPRVLSVHLYGEAVSGSLEEVPFSELPRLGGSKLLRGYRVDRFRDRAAAVGAVEYRWDLSRYVEASLFADVGRVYPSISSLTLEDLRVGYGVALEFHSDKTYLANLSLASSIDGGVFLYLSFDPVFDLKERVRRR